MKNKKTKKRVQAVKKPTKLSNLAEQAGPQKSPLLLKVGFLMMFLASAPSIELSCLRERERRTLWAPAPQQNPALRALSGVSPSESGRWVAALPSPVSC